MEDVLTGVCCLYKFISNDWFQSQRKPLPVWKINTRQGKRASCRGSWGTWLLQAKVGLSLCEPGVRILSRIPPSHSTEKEPGSLENVANTARLTQLSWGVLWVWSGVKSGTAKGRKGPGYCRGGFGTRVPQNLSSDSLHWQHNAVYGDASDSRDLSEDKSLWQKWHGDSMRENWHLPIYPLKFCRHTRKHLFWIVLFSFLPFPFLFSK